MQMLIGDTRELIPALSGAKHRAGYRASVIGILGRNAPRVSSRGSRFFNLDRWTSRKIIKEMCRWAADNPGCVPTSGDVATWVATVNATIVEHNKREIVIANTPDVLPVRTAMALTGGAYHEALHSLYSLTRNLTTKEIEEVVLPRWAKVKDWSRYVMALLQWSNLIEDVRIERCGCQEFDGIYIKMCDLQDFIIMQEAQGEDTLRGHGGKPSPLSVVERTFRDVGLGYNTDIQRNAIEGYRLTSADAVKLVLEGPLAPFLREARGLTKEDGLGSLRLAMDVLAKLAELSGDDEQDKQSKKGQCGDGETKCPQCGASAGKLVVRPQSDGHGGKVPGKGIVTCTVCGHQQLVDVEKKKPVDKPPAKALDPADPKESPRFEGFDEEEDKAAGGGGADEGDDEGDEPNKGTGKGKAGKDDPGTKDKDGDNAGGGKETDKGDPSGDDTPGKGTTEGGGEDDPSDDMPPEEGTTPEDGDAGGGEGDADPTDGTHNADPKDGGTDADVTAPGAGGHLEGPEELEGNDWSDLTQQIAAEANEDQGLLEAGSALEASIGAVQAKEDKAEAGEKVWKPYAPESDRVNIVKPSARGKAADLTAANKILETVKAQSAYLRSRLRTLIQAQEQTRTAHGLPQGRKLSGRFLVDSRVALMGHQRPTKAYCRKTTQLDMSMAAAIVADESGSMSNQKVTATRIFMAITEPLDGLGCPVLALGFRDGRTNVRQDAKDTGDYHRTEGVIYDVFKGWNERFQSIRWRFANTRAAGGTPMSDGIQFALMGLSARNEAHRFLFVVTDGQPNWGHRDVIRRQLRLAKEAGIHIIGVGIGKGAVYVKTLFPDHVHSNTVGQFPKLLIAKLNELVDIRMGRGKRVKK